MRWYVWSGRDRWRAIAKAAPQKEPLHRLIDPAGKVNCFLPVILQSTADFGTRFNFLLFLEEIICPCWRAISNRRNERETIQCTWVTRAFVFA